MKDFPFQSIFITGGTGSIGQHLVAWLLEHTQVQRVTVYSRDEYKQWEMEERFPDDRLRCVLGDVRDAERLATCMEGHDVVVHAAALKQVPFGERFPDEFVKTNVTGTQNVLRAARLTKPRVVLHLSTDKAVNPSGSYGSSKLTAERLVKKAGETADETRYVSLRLGNVMHTRGTVVPRLLGGQGIIFMTDPDSTRFHLLLDDAVAHMIFAITQTLGGELVVPKLPAFRLSDLIAVLANGREVQVTGLRQGEKRHELLLAENEIARTIQTDRYFLVLPEGPEAMVHRMIAHHQGQLVPNDLVYSSANVRGLNREQLSGAVYFKKVQKRPQ